MQAGTTPRHFGALIVVAVVAIGAPAQSSGLEVGRPFTFSDTHATNSKYMQIKPRGGLTLQPPADSGLSIHGLSSVAWDADERLLYAVSDQGYIVQLRPRIDDGVLIGCEFIATFPLRDEQQQRLRKPRADAEGLVLQADADGIRGNTELVISFEGEPRIWRYRPDGSFVAALSLPPALQDGHHYVNANKGLEALTYQQRYGFITAPERPLRGTDRRQLWLYALAGRRWHYTPFDPGHSDLTSLETMPNGDLLALERRFVSYLYPIVFTLTRLQLDETPGSEAVTASTVAHFDSSQGWHVDNFEGLARVDANHYFMLSDDNASAWQWTCLIYFEIIAP